MFAQTQDAICQKNIQTVSFIYIIHNFFILHAIVCRNFFWIRFLLFLHGHSFCKSPPQRPRIFYPRFYPLHFCPILILQKEPVFPFLMFSAKQGNYWYHFYNVFGMTRSLTGDWTRDLSHSKPALHHYRGGGHANLTWNTIAITK